MDELRYRDPENSFEEADYECMQDTDQEQSIINLETSDDYIPILERKWKDIIANECSHSLKWETPRQRKKQMEQFVGN